jgi:hypothetical protein
MAIQNFKEILKCSINTIWIGLHFTNVIPKSIFIKYIILKDYIFYNKPKVINRERYEIQSISYRPINFFIQDYIPYLNI